MATTDLAKLVVKLEAQTAQYVQELDKANRKLSKFSKDQDITLGGLGKTFATLAVAAATALAVITKNAIDGADELNDLSKATGVSVEQLSRLNFAAQQSGADLESITGGIRKLNLAIAEAAGNAKSDAALAFEALGISVEDASGRLKSADEVFSEVADKFAKYRDGANESEIANALFGKSFQKLLPLLNEGSEAIAEMGARADELHLTISGDLARAADEFNDRMAESKAQLVDGLGNQIAANVLPAFNELAKIWQEDSGRAEALAAAAGAIAVVLKSLVTIGIAVVSTFQQVGQAFYSVTAAQARLLTGDFSGAMSELTDGFAKITGNVEKDLEKITRIWNASPLNASNLDATAKAYYAINKGKGGPRSALFEAPNLTGMKEAQKDAEEAAKRHAAALKKLAEAAEAAREKLRDMGSDLAEQVATYGKGDRAALAYRLTVGSLAEDVKKAGAAGAELVENILAQADALERLKNATAVQEIDLEIQALTGHTREAALAAFDLQNALLRDSLTQQGDAEGLAKLDQLRALTAAQAAFTEQQERQTKVLEALALAEERIQHSQAVGAINELEALEQLSEARKGAAEDLAAIAAAQDEIARKSGNPELVKGAEESARALERLRQETNLLEDKIRTTFTDAGSDAFASFLKGAQDAGDAVEGFFDSLKSQIADFVAQDLFRRIFGGMGQSGGGGGGFFGSIAGFLGGLFGGSRDSGGDGEPGKAYLIGRGAQPEMFVPKSRGTFVPAGAMAGAGAIQQTNHFHIDGPVNRRTEQQIAVATARGAQMAQRRSG